MVNLKVQETNKGQLIVTLSKPIALALKIQKGDIVHWFINNKGELCLKKDGNNTIRNKERKKKKKSSAVARGSK